MLLAAGCGDDSGLPDARVGDGPPQPGTFSLSWTLSDGGAPVTCEQARAITISVALLPEGAMFGFNDVFTCSTGHGTSANIAPSTYELRFKLVGAGGREVAPGPTVMGVVIRSGEDTKIAPIAFEVDVPPAAPRQTAAPAGR